MEELVGHRIEQGETEVVGVDPDGVVVRLQRLPPATADRLLAVLQAAAGEHVETPLDIATAVNGDVVLVLPHLPTTLGALLSQGLTPGETVTILVPLAQTVERLHAAGVVHGAPGVAAVRFDERGAPVLTGFEHGSLRGLGATDPAFAAAAAADDSGFRRLAVDVLRAAGTAAAGLADEVARGGLESSALVDALFALADPAPVRLGTRPTPVAMPAPPGRLVLPTAAGEAGAPPVDPPPHRAAAIAGRALLAVRALLRGVRLRVWVAAGTSLALLAAAVVLLPGRGAAGAPEPAAGTHEPRSAPRPTPSATALALPEEPLAAARVLLAERERCLAAAALRCLAGLESAGSPVAVEDAAAVAGAGEAVAVPGSGLRLRSRSGGAAVLTAGDRTVLLLDEPGGWRIRDVIGPPTRRSTARSGDAGG